MSLVLVLQNAALRQCDLSALHTIIPPAPEYTFNDSVLRLPVSADFQLAESVQAQLLEQQIDFAIMPDQSFADLGLIISDMDSTLITIECVDEIAAGVGLQSQVAAITERSMRGEIDFEQSLRARVALLKGLPVTELQRVYENVLKLSPGAQWLLQQCHEYDVKFMLVSGGFTYFTERLQRQYGLDYTFANQLVVKNDALTGELAGRIIDAQAKADLLAEYRDKLGLDKLQVVAMGDGANDIPMLQAAGFGVAYHAKPKTQAATSISVRFGGLDTVRKWFR
ncbi:phosphoserine phosphatase SerB [Snodgrassella communis]|uniref:Phosphoserine phosphatase n=1 Tax=Snodgrassella communis TaxID=2946699 RepID=A0A066TEQ8_9NEIS|nr:phosphoserine phosphatase SerB [Snodgrassella communis]KDN13345.1 Phosphoserine phosphatase [Snodgrassella communis]KDN15647.1 Phosphoserine phosphatase [Snodgrassella communis]PIT11609.1 phosphoserine phosphatase SerB [Snodgrassella communis]PIT26344.1 phosphoserine phosphatase SerB [Snodgrassella communis]PIT28878.1 phosphoserine phosphatase SerB [Snodgrassella communis]